jgi:hypothetical protein
MDCNTKLPNKRHSMHHCRLKCEHRFLRSKIASKLNASHTGFGTDSTTSIAANQTFATYGRSTRALRGARRELTVVVRVTTDRRPVIANFRVLGAPTFGWTREKLAIIRWVAADFCPTVTNFQVLAARRDHIRTRKELTVVLGITTHRRPVVANFGIERASTIHVNSSSIICLFATHKSETSGAFSFAPHHLESRRLGDTRVAGLFVALGARVGTHRQGTRRAKKTMAVLRQGLLTFRHNGGGKQQEGNEKIDRNVHAEFM